MESLNGRPVTTMPHSQSQAVAFLRRVVQQGAASRWWPLWLSALAMALTCSSLGSGLWSDDLFQAQHFSAWLNGGQRPWWDMFYLQDGAPQRRFGGITPWWTSDTLRVRFFRPVTALTHLLDYCLWPDRPAMMHAHSVVWFGLLIVVVGRLFRRLEPDPRVACLATLFFATTWVHATTVGWLANRNAILAALFGVLALVMGLRAADQPRSIWRWCLAASLLVSSLLSAEVGISTLAFVAALAWRRREQGRALAWGPLLGGLVVVVAWRVGYQLMGFGALACGAYLDPGRSPLLFLQAAPERLAWLLAFLLAPMRLLIIDGLHPVAVVSLGLLAVVSAVAIARAGWRHRSTHGFWVIATLLALAPLAASVPGDRLLTFASLGIAPIVAKVIVDALDRPAAVERFFAGAAFASHLVISPVALAWGAYDHSHGFRESTRDVAGLDYAPDDRVAKRSVVVLWAPGYAYVHEMQAARVAAGRAVPTFTWVLGISEDEPTFERVGCCTLVVDRPDGLHREVFAANFRGPQDPFEVGAVVETLAFTATVLAVDAGGVATRVRFVFADRLDSERMLFLRWRDGDFRLADPSAGFHLERK